MNLIFTIAYGDPAWHMAFLFVESLRSFGKFEGEIIVFSQHKAEIPGATVITDIDPLAFYDVKIAKPYVTRKIDFTHYDKVMYLDVDIIALNPVEPLFAHDGICAATDFDTAAPVGLFDLPEMPRAPGEHGFNSGIIVAPSRCWPYLCQQWWAKLMECSANNVKFKWADQPVFNWLAMSGAIKIDPLPLPSVFMHLPGQNLGLETILFHATQTSKWHILNGMLQMRKLLP